MDTFTKQFLLQFIINAPSEGPKISWHQLIFGPPNYVTSCNIHQSILRYSTGFRDLSTKDSLPPTRLRHRWYVQQYSNLTLYHIRWHFL